MLSRFRYILLFGIMLFISLRSMSQLAMPDNVCIGAVKRYYVDPNPGSTYIWRINEVPQGGAVTNEINITWNTPGIFTLDVQELSADGCLGPVRSGQVVVNPLPTITVSSTLQPDCSVPTGSILLTDLPAGNWIINPGAISGTGSTKTISGLVPGTYNYTVTSADGCTSPPTGNIVILLQPVTPSAPTVSTSVAGNICPAESINLTSLITSVTPAGGTILFKTTNDASGIDVPDPSAVGTGTYYIFYRSLEGCYSSGTLVTGTILPCTKTLNLSAIMLQGLYSGSGEMNRASNGAGFAFTDPLISDLITVELHNSSYSSVAFTATNVNLSTTGTATVIVPAALNGSYYITIKHRNHIEITTATTVAFSGSTITYSYNLPSKVYGDNLILLPGPGSHYAIYGGDSNADGVTDGLDLINVENGATLFSTGYLSIDLNGDGVVDALDLIIAENNAFNFVSVKHP